MITAHQRHRQTDRRTTCDPKTAHMHLSALRGNKMIYSSITWPFDSPYAIFVGEGGTQNVWHAPWNMCQDMVTIGPSDLGDLLGVEIQKERRKKLRVQGRNRCICFDATTTLAFTSVHLEHTFWQFWNELLHTRKPIILLNKPYCVQIKSVESLLQTNDYTVI